MNLELLKNFVAVVDADSFTEASRRIFVSQPCVSKRISTFEQELGVQLIVRDKHSPHIILTDAGRLLYDESRPLIADLDGVESKIQQMKAKSDNKIKIYTIIPSFKEINDICLNFRKAFPESDLELTRNSFDLINESLANGTIDIGAVFSFELPNLAFPHLKMRIRKDRFVAVFSNTHKLAGRGSISLDELRDESLICMYPMPYRFIQKNGLIPSQLLKVPHETFLLNIQENRGYGIAPRLAAVTENNISILEIEGLDETCDVYIIWREDNANPMLRRFLDIARQP